MKFQQVAPTYHIGELPLTNSPSDLSYFIFDMPWLRSSKIGYMNHGVWVAPSAQVAIVSPSIHHIGTCLWNASSNVLHITLPSLSTTGKGSRDSRRLQNYLYHSLRYGGAPPKPVWGIIRGIVLSNHHKIEAPVSSMSTTLPALSLRYCKSSELQSESVQCIIEDNFKWIIE